MAKFKLTIYMSSGDIFVFKLGNKDAEGLEQVINLLTQSFKDRNLDGEIRVKGVHFKVTDISAYQLQNVWF